MKASAPGKLVLSGAYSVLRGAPSIVSAVDRRVTADDGSPADYASKEVLAGLSLLGLNDDFPRPLYDASALREDDRKIGLGSSAGICVSSLALVLIKKKLAEKRPWTPRSIVHELYPLALKAHRLAQGGGSGIDVAAACFGGTLRAELATAENEQGERLQIAPLSLPQSLVWEVWASNQEASTADFVKRVFSLEQSAPDRFRDPFERQVRASHEATDALERGDVAAFVCGLRSQFAALWALGKAANVDIVLPAIAHLAALVPEDHCFLPSGAGGGDVTLHVGPAPSSHAFREEARAADLTLVPLSLGASGLDVIDPDAPVS